MALAGEIIQADELFARKSTDTARGNNTITADPHLSVTLQANSTYTIEGWLAYTCTATGPDFKVGLTAPSGAAGRWSAAGPANAIAGNEGDGSWISRQINIGDIQFGTNSSTTFPFGIIIRGTVRTGSTAGNLTVDWAQVNTDGANVVTMLTDSWLEVVRR